MPGGIYFFIAPEEQRDWILTEMKVNGQWCVVRHPMRTPYRQVTEKEVAALEWTGRDSAELSIFLGDPEVSPPLLDSPQWTVTRGFDVAHSGAVQLWPSLLTPDKKVLEGGLAMLGKHQLDYYGMYGAPTRDLYKMLRKSLSRLWEKDSVVMYMNEKWGPTATHTHISRGALALYRKGWGLSCTSGVPITFEAWDREAAKKAKVTRGTGGPKKWPVPRADHVVANNWWYRLMRQIQGK